MYRTLIFFAALALASANTYAQSAVPVRGTITGLQGNELDVSTRDGRDMKVELTRDTTILYTKAIKLTDLKPGTRLGTTAVPGPDGKLVAKEVHVSLPDRPFTNEGHFPMANIPGATMTNATVSAAGQLTNGRELTLTYKGGSQVVIVPDNTPVSMPVAGDRSYLVRGEFVSLSAAMNNDGKLVASRVQVSKDGAMPPGS